MATRTLLAEKGGTVAEAGDGNAAHCFADDYDLSAGMVYTGWALADGEAGKRYLETERGARDGRRGLWRGDFVAPREWRQGRRLDAGAAQ